jgi:hypothetical protein
LTVFETEIFHIPEQLNKYNYDSHSGVSSSTGNGSKWYFVRVTKENIAVPLFPFLVVSARRHLAECNVLFFEIIVFSTISQTTIIEDLSFAKTISEQ